MQQESQRAAELSRELEKQKENKQVEEILRLEKEIEDLQRMKERQELSLTEASLQKLQQLRDEELRRLEDEACRAAQEFLESLNFDEIDECVRNIERSLSVGSGCAGEQAAGAEKPSFNFSQPYPEEEEVDEGFEADDDAFKDSPNPSEHGHSDQRTSGIRTSDESSEEDPYMNDTVVPTSPSADSTVLLAPSEHDSSAGESTYCLPQTPGALPAPEGDYDYDQDDYEDGAITSGSSVTFSNSCSSQWSPDYRCSGGTYNSSGAYRFSSEGAQSSVSTRWPGATHFLAPRPLLALTGLEVVCHPRPCCTLPGMKTSPHRMGQRQALRAGLRPISLARSNRVRKWAYWSFNTKPRELHFAQSLRKLACSVENLAGVCPGFAGGWEIRPTVISNEAHQGPFRESSRQ